MAGDVDLGAILSRPTGRAETRPFPVRPHQETVWLALLFTRRWMVAAAIGDGARLSHHSTEANDPRMLYPPST